MSVHAEPPDPVLDPTTRAVFADGPDPVASHKVEVAARYAGRTDRAERRIVLRYLGSPLAVLGRERVEGVRIGRNRLAPSPDGTPAPVPTGEEETIEAGLVLRAVGYRGTALPRLPFDEARGTLPHQAGRVLAQPSGTPLPGVYATGWIKRGPSGVIGSNRRCAAETIGSLLADHEAGRLRAPTRAAAELDELVARRRPDALTYDDWKAIDVHERHRTPGRPRTKMVDVASMVSLARHGGRS